MATRKSTKGSATTTPEVDPSLQILAQRTEQLESALQLMALNVAQLSQTVENKFAEFLEQQRKEKEAAAQGAQAAIEQLQTLREQTPMSQADLQKFVAAAQREAQTNVERKQAKFAKELRDMKRVTINNTTGHVIQLQVNGHKVVLQPGLNKRVPEVFRQVYEQHLDGVKQAQEAAAMIANRAGATSFVDLENWIHRGRQADVQRDGLQSLLDTGFEL